MNSYGFTYSEENKQPVILVKNCLWTAIWLEGGSLKSPDMMWRTIGDSPFIDEGIWLLSETGGMVYTGVQNKYLDGLTVDATHGKLAVEIFRYISGED